MPKQFKEESVLHDWVHRLTFQMQALLLTAMRGPDENNKYNAAKAIIRYLRGIVIKPAGDWHGKNDNDFMWGEYIGKHVSPAGNGFSETTQDIGTFRYYAGKFWEDHDEYPHHFIMHLVHCAEVAGYKHPDNTIRSLWLEFYLEACNAFHMNPESEDELDKRLSDFGCGIHNELPFVVN